MSNSLKYYHDLMSQPSRALYIILKLSKTPFEDCKVALGSGEHLTERYKNEVCRFLQVPCIIDKDGFKLTESIAIIRYLDRSENRISKALYPDDIKKRAAIDEYLEWQHFNTRMGCGMYCRKKYVDPVLLRKEPNEAEIKLYKERMEKALDSIENIWLANTKFLCSNELSLADIFGVCEVVQATLGDYDPTEGRPKLKTWLETVREQCNPYYDEAHKLLNAIVEKSNTRL